MLVQRILAFGRREPVELKAQSLQPLLQETVALLRATLPAGVTLAWRVAPDPWPVRADATQVQQVLLNLGINAAQAVPHAQGRIEIGLDFVTLAQDATLPPDLAPGRYARLWVSDDGCGMDEATRARAFEPFFTTKPAGQGTGLGLFAVQDIARRHGGAVTLASAVGQGTTVRLMLPVADDRPAPVVAEGRPQPEARGDALSSQGLRVLYVDDDETVAALAERLLRRAGCVPVIHTDAERALQALRADTGAVDAVVTDHHMPRMSGLELAAAVRSAAPQLPVLLGSGHVDAALQAACARAGVHELLRKERLAEQLVPAVVRAVAAARRGGSPPDAA
jgi:CheY-like chemotaxis protein